MGISNMCKHCGSDWCGGECVTEKYDAEVKALKDSAETMRIHYAENIDAMNANLQTYSSLLDEERGKVSELWEKLEDARMLNVALNNRLKFAKTPLADDGSPLRVQTAMAMQGFGAESKEVLVKEIHRLRTLVDTLRVQNTDMQDARQTASWDYRHLLQELEEVKAARDLLQLGHDAGCTDESHLLLKQEAEQAEQEDLVITLKAKQLCQTYGWEVDGETEGWTTRALREIPALMKRLEYAEGYAAGAHESCLQLQEHSNTLSREWNAKVRRAFRAGWEGARTQLFMQVESAWCLYEHQQKESS